MVLKMLAAALAVTAFGAACGDATDEGTGFDVVVGFYPLGWAAEEIGGDRISVTNLTAAGGEPHDLELSPKQVDTIENAELLIDLGGNFQPALADVAATPEDSLGFSAPEDPHIW